MDARCCFLQYRQSGSAIDTMKEENKDKLNKEEGPESCKRGLAAVPNE